MLPKNLRCSLVVLCIGVFTINATALAQNEQINNQERDGRKTITIDPFSDNVHLTSPRASGDTPTVVPAQPKYPNTALSNASPLGPRTQNAGWTKVSPPLVVPAVAEVKSAPWRPGTEPVHPLSAEIYSRSASSLPAPQASGRMQARSTAASTEVAYSIELKDPLGNIIPVSASRTFHTGERIRFHFKSPVDGRIVIVQREPDGISDVLYPKPTFTGSDWVRADLETIIPAAGAWFDFDSIAGDCLLFITIRGTMPEKTTAHEETAPHADTGSKSLRLVLEPEPLAQMPKYGIPSLLQVRSFTLQVNLHQER